MIDPKIAGKILKEHFDTVTPEEFREWHDKYVVERQAAYPLIPKSLEELEREVSMTGAAVDGFLAKLKELDGLRDTDIVRRGEVGRIQPSFAEEWPAQLDRQVRNAIVASGIDRPYQHQFDAIVKSLSGSDVVMETPDR